MTPDGWKDPTVDKYSIRFITSADHSTRSKPIRTPIGISIAEAHERTIPISVQRLISLSPSLCLRIKVLRMLTAIDHVSAI